jgi:hypothetical protein
MTAPRYGFVRANALTLAFGGLFLVTLVGQAIAGTADHNARQVANGLPTVSFLDFVTSSSFGVDVMENWQSEYLQFFLFIYATVWLIQLGSTESKPVGEEGKETDEEQKVGRYAQAGSPVWAKAGGWRTALYSNSLLILMAILFVGSWFAQSVTGWNVYNADAADHGGEKLSWLQFIGTADFWEATLQNWQSEFLAVGSFAVLAVYLRQRGSPESKPVGAPHDSTGIEG